MKVFSDPRFNIDVLKVEVPVNVKYVEGFGDGEIVHTREEAAAFFKAQDEATNLPYIYLSAVYQLNSSKKPLSLPTNQAQTSTVFFVAVQLGLDQLKLTSKMVKQQLVNGFVLKDVKTLKN